LEESNWVVNHAVAAIKQDEEWEEDDKITRGGGEVEEPQKAVGCFSWAQKDDKETLLVCSIHP
jgi:hypothetical protein